MAHEAAPGRALSPYLLTQGANEPFQVLLLVQHHLLLLVLLLQLHLQLPELCGRNPATLSARPPLKVPCPSRAEPLPWWGRGIPQERECIEVSAASTEDQEWPLSPGAPATPGSASEEEGKHSRDLQDFGDRMGYLKHTHTCPRAAPAALEFVFAPTNLMALWKGYFLQIVPKHEALDLAPLVGHWCYWEQRGHVLLHVWLSHTVPSSPSSPLTQSLLCTPRL